MDPVIGEAISHLERSLEGPGVDQYAEYLLNSLYIRRGRVHAGDRSVERLLKSEPDDPAALRLLVKAYESIGQGARADTTALHARRPRA